MFLKAEEMECEEQTDRTHSGACLCFCISAPKRWYRPLLDEVSCVSNAKTIYKVIPNLLRW